ncbi:uncharacterized protein LOC135388301 isoform X3 [Ornithodoros turicata]|uniref:uncharacterized protein LOC135388301 isoform X3 n=1 Tax=Ornithodoros turicata TaxID=34597 RepID=UPI0031387B8F
MNTSLKTLIVLAACIALGTGAHGITCEPAFIARWFFSGRALHCHYRCAWSIRNYGLEDDGTPCIIEIKRFGVCYQGYCVDNLPPTTAKPVPKEATTRKRLEANNNQDIGDLLNDHDTADKHP